MSKIEVDKVDPQSGTALEIGTSGDTVTVPSGVGLTLTDSTLLLPTTITSTTEVLTNKISPATGVAFALGDSGDTFTVPSGATIVNSGTATGFGGGKIGQVVSTHFTTQSQMSSDSFAAITGMTVAITPAATDSKIFITLSLSAGVNQNTFARFKLLRGVTVIGSGSDSSSRIGCNFATEQNAGTDASDQVQKPICYEYLDSPSTTSETTYTVQASTYSSFTIAFNKSANNSDDAKTAQTSSVITAMEVLA